MPKSPQSSPSGVTVVKNKKKPAARKAPGKSTGVTIDSIKDMLQGVNLEDIMGELAGMFLEDDADASTLLDRLLDAGPASRRDDDVGEIATDLSAALDQLRIDGNGGMTTAKRELERLRAKVDTRVQENPLSPDILLALGFAFSAAKLEPSGQLRAALETASLCAQDVSAEPPSQEEFERTFREMAEAMDHDPFDLHEQMANMSAATSLDHRVMMGAVLVSSTDPLMQQVGFGFVLSPEKYISDAALDALKANKKADPKLLAWAVRSRPWLSAARRPALDEAIAAIRRNEVEPILAGKAKPVQIKASYRDGSGAQSVIAVVQRQNRYIVVSVLIKAAEGIADTLIIDEGGKGKAQSILRDIGQRVALVDIGRDYFQNLLARALATNVENDTPPPFRLLHVVDLMELPLIGPLAETIEDRIAALLRPEEIEAHRSEVIWKKKHKAAVESWFEAGEEVDAALQGRASEKTKAERLWAFVQDRRAYWAAQCIVTAEMLKSAKNEGWIDFAIAAHDLVGTTKAKDISVLNHIVDQTIASAKSRSFYSSFG